MSKPYSLSGDINKRGDYALSPERSLKDILKKEAGGIRDFRNLKMIQIGGPLGICLTGDEINRPVGSFDNDLLSNSIYFFSDLFCPVDYLRFLTRYMIREVRLDTDRMRQLNTIMESISQGNGNKTDLQIMKARSASSSGNEETRADELFNTVFNSVTDKFESEIMEHIHDRKCKNGICRGMIESQCINACPAEIHIPGFVELMKRDRYSDAYTLMRQNNPLSFICGKVCARPCEDRCRRKEIESTVGVRALQKFAASEGLDSEDFTEEKRPANNKKIAIAGAGPCGLSAAYYLARSGYDVTIYESEKHVGGMLAFGVPEYRLPYGDIQKEVRTIEKLGVTIKTSTKIGTDISLDQLKQENDAVFLATGSHKGNSLPGFSHQNIETAAAFLKRVRLSGKKEIGTRVLVVGGGDVAMDAARTSLRLGAQEVSVLSLESYDHMPASLEERVQAKEENIRFIDGWGIKSITESENGGEKNGESLKVEYQKCTRVFDDNDRFSPEFDSEQIRTIEVDSIIAAIGQKPELEYLGNEIEQNRGFITVDPRTFETNSKGVFAAGDVTGVSIAIKAIADGKKAALQIDRYLGGEGLYTGDPIEIPETPLSVTTWDDPLVEEKLAAVNDRVCGFSEVTGMYTLEEAKFEAARCMRCDRNSRRTLQLTPKR